MSKYQNDGQVGAMGDNARSDYNNFNQGSNFNVKRKISKAEIEELNNYLNKLESMSSEVLPSSNRRQACLCLDTLINAAENEDNKAVEKEVYNWREWFNKVEEKTKKVLAETADIVTIGLFLKDLLFK